MSDANNIIENIQGYRTITVVHDDGVREEVNVKKLNVYELKSYAMTYGDQGKTVELLCNKPESWVATLPYEEAEKILEIGTEINDPILAKFAARDATLTNTALKFLTAKVDQVQRLSALAESSSRQLSSPAQPLTRSSNGLSTES